jgi:hypothetical protein
MKHPYKITTKMTGNYNLEVSATPQYEAVTALYREISKGIDEELIRNMPESAVVKLLSQLLEHYMSQSEYCRDEAHHLLLKLKAEYNI